MQTVHSGMESTTSRRNSPEIKNKILLKNFQSKFMQINFPGRTINSFFLPDNNTGGPSTGQAYIQLQLGIETQLVAVGLQI